LRKRTNTYFRIPSQVASRSDLTPADKLVYGAMLAYSNKSGVCFASHERISLRISLSRQSVSRSISRLISARLLERIDCSAHGGFKGGRTACYRCLLDIPKRHAITALPRPTV